MIIRIAPICPFTKIHAISPALTISSGTLTPTFNTNTTSYTASVTSTTSSIKVTPTVPEAAASVFACGPLTGNEKTGSLPTDCLQI